MDSVTMIRIRAVAGLVVLIYLQLASSHPTFQSQIPNGNRIPSPCNASEIWQGVGHMNHLGGGERNPFGKAFKSQGYMWTQVLCQADSDGDGKTNGEELGDPYCEWSKDATPLMDMDLSHPGICEPIESELCMAKNTFEVCPTRFECDALKDPDVVQHVLKLTDSPVPAEETTYMCQAIDLPSDRDYHVIGMTPHLDNENVIHHILVYGCDDSANLTDLATPQKCFMTNRRGCSDLIAIWAVGGEGSCHHGDTGFRVGLTSFKRVIMELHWNNPERVPTYRDGSGVILHLTPNLRSYDAGMIMYGQNALIIPPGRESHVINGTCPSQCTNEYMSGAINIVGVTNHMHYLGSEALSQLQRGDTGELITLGKDTPYSYNTPVFHTFDDPLVMNPGDELHLMCKFNSQSRDRTTFQGEATNDEMCYAFVMYYPKKTWHGRPCVASGPVGPCQWNNPVIAGCEMKYLDPSNPVALKMFNEVDNRCIVGHCLEECLEYTKELVKNPCFHPELKYVLQDDVRDTNTLETLTAMRFWYKLDSCRAEIAKEVGCGSNGNWTTRPPVIGGAPRNTLAPFVAVIALLIAAFF